MRHPDEDRLLQCILEILEDSECAEVREHLSHCTQCREVEGRLRGDVERMRSVGIRLAIFPPRGLEAHTSNTVRKWSWAAGLAAGFLLGFFSAQFSHDDKPVPVPQRLMTQEAGLGNRGFIPCPVLDAGIVRNP